MKPPSRSAESWSKEPARPAMPRMLADLDVIISSLEGKTSLAEVAPSARWTARQSMYRFRRDIAHAGLSPAVLAAIRSRTEPFTQAIEYVPTWVVFAVALALGSGTMIGYKRIVVTVAEKIGKQHMAYAQGAAAELIAAVTISLADVVHMPVSTTQVLSSGVAGTMWANRSGLQRETIQKIGLVWVTTLPAAILLAATLFTVGGLLIPSAKSSPEQPPAAAAEQPVAGGDWRDPQ